MRVGKEARRGVLAVLAGAALSAFGAGPAHAATCDLAGSGPEGATDTSLYQVPGATLKASMIFVEFQDKPASVAEAPPDAPGSIGDDIVDAAKAYFEEASYLRTQLDVQMDDEWVTLDGNAGDYGATTFAQQRSYIAEAVAKADAAGFDFSGRQTVYVVAAPTDGDLPNSPAFHAFASDAVVADGTAIRWGSTMGDDVRRASPNYGSHILVHETGHTFGLPDLYRYGASLFENSHLDAGAWDIMGWIGPGFGMTAWHKRKIGWLTPSEWTCVEGTATGHINPPFPSGGTKMMVTRASPSVAYAAEVREPAIGTLDEDICDSGVLIYRVDANAAGGGGLSGAAPLSVKLAHPEAPGDPNDQDCGALSTAPFDVGPGETSTFTEAGVTIEILSGNPATGYDVRMTGPALPSGDGAQPAAKKKCKKGRKLKKGKCVKKKRKKRKGRARK